MYTAYRTREKIEINGKLNEESWLKAPRSPRFVNMIDGQPALYETRAAVLWDDEYLYIGFWIEEPYVNGTLTEQGAPLYTENNIELFIDGGDTYYELAVNALNTIYEVFFIWKDSYQPGGKYDIPEFNLLERQASTFQGYYKEGKDFWDGIHPRGVRWAFRDWNFPGLKTAVHVDGVLNDMTKKDKGWTVELAFTWEGMNWLANGRALPPDSGDVWNLFFGRFENLLSLNKSVSWSWNPTGINDSHRPERFTPIQFSNDYIEDVEKNRKS